MMFLIRDERDVFKSDIERYNEKNPDNPIREKDGEYYNRFGISESGNMIRICVMQ